MKEKDNGRRRGILNATTLEAAREAEKMRDDQPIEQPKPGREKKDTLRQRLQKHMAAIAYAEAGEFETAEELTEPSSRTKTVLLVIEGETPDPAAFNYALKLCKRTNAELDILQVIASGDEHDYESLSQKMTEGTRNIVAMVKLLEQDDVLFKVTIRLGDVNQKLFNYAKRHKDVGMVVFDSPKAREGSQAYKRWSRLVEEISRQLSIPLVTVVESTP
ncbi:MAG TPA: hypothetical protein VK463_15155 [Desulfomonilaceae bacterium]|nr:hypothetical protein [Desulfomonilaceae bacterium]